MKDKMYKKIVDCLKTYTVCLDMDFNEECYRSEERRVGKEC